MNKKKYNRSFARKLTRWIMVVLFIMMSVLSFYIYKLSKRVLIEVSADTFHSSMQASAGKLSDKMSDVRVAVINNIFDIEAHLSQPDALQGILQRLVDQNPSIRSCGISFIENYYPQKGCLFCPYALRHDSLQTQVPHLDASHNNYLQDEWFLQALEADSSYWSAPFLSGLEVKTPLVAYLCPIHDKQGRVVAILGADLSLDFMTQLLWEQDSIFVAEGGRFSDIFEENVSSYLLARDGTYVTHPDPRRILNANFFVHIKDAGRPGRAQKTIEAMSEGMRSSNETNNSLMIDRTECYLFYAPFKETDCVLAVCVPKLAADIFGKLVGIAMFAVIAFMQLVTFFVCRLTIRHAAKPLKELAATADKVAGGQFDTVLPIIKSRDEIGLLRDSFENMQHSLADYVDELKTTTTAKASMERELNIAHNIQMAMLPKTYPAFPDRDDLDIYGQVTPAKAVGGDLYDFFIRDENLFFCIGDVSGKGVPASLVMAVTRSLFRNIASYTAEPDHIVFALNEALSNNNDTIMFVTLFMGVLDLATGHISYSNAGHNAPLIVHTGRVSQLTCDANVPVGVVAGWKFTIQHIQLQQGETIFLYTDGLNEAEDIHHRQFGMERVEQVASVTINRPQSLIEAMTSSVKMFVGDAEQSDDMTMLAVQYTRNPENKSQDGRA